MLRELSLLSSTAGDENLMAGYSKRTLVEKLGIKRGFRCLAVSSPSAYMKLLGKLPEGVSFDAESSRAAKEGYDFIHAFFETRAGVEPLIQKYMKYLKKDGIFWASWKKGKVTDVSENEIRGSALAAGLVDVKVCAVDEIWSGLKLVLRLKDR